MYVFVVGVGIEPTQTTQHNTIKLQIYVKVSYCVLLTEKRPNSLKTSFCNTPNQINKIHIKICVFYNYMFKRYKDIHI